MSTNDTSNESVITSYALAPARTIDAGGITYASQELGPKVAIHTIGPWRHRDLKHANVFG